MPTSVPNLIYASGGSYDTAVACSLPVFSAPFEGVNIDYLLTQDFVCAAANYAAEDLNTPHTDYPEFLLAKESEKRDQAGGMVRWTRTYAKVPTTYSQPGSVLYNFIGYATSDTPALIGRDRFTVAAAARIQYDYFLLAFNLGGIGVILDETGAVVFTGTAGVLPSVADIPILLPQEYFYAGIGSVKRRQVFDSISYGQDSGALQQTVFPTPNPADTDYPPYAAYPTRGVYESWINRTTTVSYWDEDSNSMIDTGLYEIVAVGSQCARWQGNIIERQTTYVRPQ